MMTTFAGGADALCSASRRRGAARNGALPPALLAAALLAWVGAPLPAAADDHFNLEEGLPVTTEDVYPIVYGGREFQSVFTYQRSRDADARDLFSLEPRLALGLFPRVQATPRVCYSLGTAEGKKSGTAGIDGLYQLNDETPVLPVFSVSGSFNAPYGFEHSANETVLKLIVAKSLGDGKDDRDVHLNLAWTHNYGPTGDERADRFEGGIAYAHPINETLLLVTDYVYEQELERGKAANLVELGARIRVSEELAAAIGVGVGLGANSPSFRVTAGIQRAVDWFGGWQ
jgi:hypothetical protein